MPLRREWVHRLFGGLARAYPDAQKGGLLLKHLEGMLDKHGSRTPTTVKIISVNPNSRLSLQYHRHRAEEWFCLKGNAVATLGESLVRHPLGVGETVSVPLGVLHRLESAAGADILEVATGHFDEQDIVRLADDYARADR
jgi:mannose-6-phosphate isomerase